MEFDSFYRAEVYCLPCVMCIPVTQRRFSAFSMKRKARSSQVFEILGHRQQEITVTLIALIPTSLNELTKGAK